MTIRLGFLLLAGASSATSAQDVIARDGRGQAIGVIVHDPDAEGVDLSSTPVRSLSDKEALDAADRYANCLVASRASRKDAQRFLDTDPSTEQRVRLGVELLTSTCLAQSSDTKRIGQLRIPYGRLSPLLYGALYRRDFSSATPHSLTTSVEIDREVKPFIGDAGSTWAANRIVGDCAVRKDWEAAHALVISPISGTASHEWYERARRSFLACGWVPSKQTDDYVRLRDVAAEAVYKVAVASLAAGDRVDAEAKN